MKWVRIFKEVSKNDASIAGGKGASLGEMTRADIPVPSGFVVTADAFEHFLEETDINVEIDAILKTVKTDNMATVERASEKIQALILAKKIPPDIHSDILENFRMLDAEFVAVRSSATAEDGALSAWAGQLDTFLNTTDETLMKNTLKCWASLFTPRAVFYRFEKGFHQTKISVAVVVQRMVDAEVAGVTFSVHPVTEDRNQMIIEGAFGLGEGVVSGHITPDSYVVTKEPLEIIDTNVVLQDRGLFRKKGGGNEWRNLSKEDGIKQKLSDEKIIELSKAVLNIEKHYGFPVDVEWAVEKETIYILQSRPITTLTSSTS